VPADLLPCGNCGQAMRRLVLAGHYGRQVEIDACGPCHLVWFDNVESVRLSGPGMLELLDAMVQAQSEPHHVLQTAARCPRCAGALKTIHNRSRWGPTVQLECQRGHGAYQTFAQFLSEKGLIRPLGARDRAALLRDRNGLACLNCGAAMGQDDTRCSYCDALPGMVDVARLASALDPEGATESHAVHGAAARHASLHCLACGAPLPDGQTVHCGSCGATLAVAQLADAHAAVTVLAGALRAHALSPAPHVVERRLARLDADLPKRREWARGMEAEAARNGWESGEDRGFWDDLRETPYTVAAFAVFLLFLWWLFWG
jgi:predicted nucleic acid-binding Zn ribbon protein